MPYSVEIQENQLLICELVIEDLWVTSYFSSRPREDWKCKIASAVICGFSLFAGFLPEGRISADSIEIQENQLLIHKLVIEDPLVMNYLSSIPREDWERNINDTIESGFRIFVDINTSFEGE